MMIYLTTMKSQISAIPKDLSMTLRMKVNETFPQWQPNRSYAAWLKAWLRIIANVACIPNLKTHECLVLHIKYWLISHIKKQISLNLVNMIFFIYRTSWWYLKAKAIGDRWSGIRDCRRRSSPGWARKIGETSICH